MNSTSQTESSFLSHGEKIGLWVDGFGKRMSVLLGLFLLAIIGLMLVLSKIGTIIYLISLDKKDVLQVSQFVRIPCLVGIPISTYVLYVAWYLFENSGYHIGKLIVEVLDEWFD